METVMQTPKKAKKPFLLFFVILIVVAVAVAAVVFLLKKTNADKNDAESNSLTSAKVGDVITLGKYEQDNNLENGAEDIEWIVMDKDKDGNLLLASKYILDNKEFDEYTNVWHDSALREWLNGMFYDSAFSKEEQALVHPISYTDTVQKPVDKNASLSAAVNNPEVTYEDHVLLPTVNLIQKDELKNKEKWIKATPYVMAQGITCIEEAYANWWCLDWETNVFNGIGYDTEWASTWDDRIGHTYDHARANAVTYCPQNDSAFPAAMTVEKFEEIIGQLDSDDQLNMNKYYLLVDMDSVKDKPQEKKTILDQYSNAEELGQLRVLKSGPSTLQKNNIQNYLETAGFTEEDKAEQEKLVGYDPSAHFEITAYAPFGQNAGVRPAIWIDPYATTKNKR